MKKIFKRIVDVFCVIIIGLEVLLMLSTLISNIKGEAPQVFGYSVYKIQTGSMEPTIKVGDLIICKEYKGQDLEENKSVVTYIAQEGPVQGQLVTHRYIETNEDGLIICKGDANSAKDEPLDPQYIKSVMVYKTKIIGPIYNKVTSGVGYIFFIILPISAIVIYEFISIALVKREEDLKEQNQKVD